MHRTALSDMTFLPLKLVSPGRYSSLVAGEEKKIALLNQEGYFNTRPGLSEQYKLQLDSLKEGRDPGCEVVFMNFFFVPTGGTCLIVRMRVFLSLLSSRGC